MVFSIADLGVVKVKWRSFKLKKKEDSPPQLQITFLVLLINSNGLFYYCFILGFTFDSTFFLNVPQLKHLEVFTIPFHIQPNAFLGICVRLGMKKSSFLEECSRKSLHNCFDTLSCARDGKYQYVSEFLFTQPAKVTINWFPSFSMCNFYFHSVCGTKWKW